MSAAPTADDADLGRLRAVAASLDDLFELPLADAPAYSFVGGMVSVQVAGGRILRFSAGAADPERAQAFRRCIGEAAETRAQFLTGRPAGQVVRLDGPSGLAADEALSLRELRGGTIDESWTPAVRLSGGTPSTLPLALCYRDATDGPAVATSLGCAAGRTLEEATRSALFELIERDAIAMWWEGGKPATLVGGFEEEVGRMRAGQRHRRTWFLLVSNEFGVPVVAALSCDAAGFDVAAGFAARETVEAAAAAALRELAQMELGNRLVAMKRDRSGEDSLADGERNQLARMTALGADDPRLSGNGPARGGEMPAAGLTPTAIASRLAASGIEVHGVDLTLPSVAIPTIKLVAPLLHGGPGRPAVPRLANIREIHRWNAGDVSPVSIL